MNVVAPRSSMAAVVAQSKSPATSPLSPSGSAARRGLSAALNAPADGLGTFPPVGAQQQQLIPATTQLGSSGKLQSKRIFNAVDMLVQVAD